MEPWMVDVCVVLLWFVGYLCVGILLGLMNAFLDKDRDRDHFAVIMWLWPGVLMLWPVFALWAWLSKLPARVVRCRLDWDEKRRQRKMQRVDDIFAEGRND